MRPLIGITGRMLAHGIVREPDQRFVSEPMNVFFSAYDDLVAAAGALPLDVPFAAAGADAMSRLDGLLVTGGQDVHPARSSSSAPDLPGDPRTSFAAPDQQRDAYEESLIRAAIEYGRPVLAVCRGMQLLNVVHGGTLIQHLETTDVDHDSGVSAPAPAGAQHVVRTAPGSIVRTLYGEMTSVNSWHHQAVDGLGEGLTATASATDGIIEAIESESGGVLGVQWHPEWQPGSDPVFGWLVSAAKAAHSMTGALIR